MTCIDKLKNAILGSPEQRAQRKAEAEERARWVEASRILETEAYREALMTSRIEAAKQKGLERGRRGSTGKQIVGFLQSLGKVVGDYEPDAVEREMFGLKPKRTRKRAK